MGKRRRVDTDDDFSDPSGSESSDTSDSKPKRGQPANKRKRETSKPTLYDRLTKGKDAATELVASPHPISSHVISSSEPIRVALLKWYAGVHESRGMPWRKPWDPKLDAEQRAQRAYEVWISEIMLQQTQVATVIGYYKRWMEKYPTLPDLAKASIDDVNALWKGLGYYSRASRILEGAQKAVKEMNGRLPDSAKDLQAKIPGIGRYSAGAISSIAYGERAPVLDGNVNRLLSRLLALHANPKAKNTLDILWDAATAMVSKSRANAQKELSGMAADQHPGDINQALIELGSTVCKPKEPACRQCPLTKWCSAYNRAHGNKASDSLEVDIEDLCQICEPLPADRSVTIFPMKAEKKKAREELDLVVVYEWRPDIQSKQRQFLLVRRPDGGLLAGLYEFPTMANISSTTSSAKLKDLPYEVASMYIKGKVEQPESETDTSSALRVARLQAKGDVLHIFSHIRKTYRVQHALLVGGDEPPQLKIVGPAASKIIESQWVEFENVSKANIGTGVAKIWKLIH